MNSMAFVANTNTYTYTSFPTTPQKTNPTLLRKITPTILCKSKNNNKPDNQLSSSLSMSSSMSMKPTLKERLRTGDKLYGMFMLSFSPFIAEIAGHAGYDFVIVDMEHGPGGFMEAVDVMRCLAASGTPAILRLPESDPALAKKAMDLGPQGIMFPMIDSPKAAKRAVSYCRYPPRGVRGAAFSAVRASNYGLDEKYLENVEDDLVIMCQIESEEAVEKIEEIAAVEGVDCLQMGPTDLASDMGFLGDLGNKKAKEMLMRAEKAVLGKGQVFLAGFAMAHDPPLELQSRGYHMVSGACDTILFRDAVIADLKKHKFTSTEASENSHAKEPANAELVLDPQIVA